MILGIDFGTCNSSAALMINDQIRLVKEPVKLGYSFPSSVYLTEEGEVIVGQIAENRKLLNPTCYRREFKRDLLQDTPYFLGNEGEYQFTPQELITQVIKNLKKEASKIETSTISKAVITIPATYKKNKKDLMKKAVQKADFSYVKLLEEPVAASIYYDYQNPDTFEDGDIVLVYDLGGGTFDATLIKKVGTNFQLLGQPIGLENCGGIDFDRAIFEDVKNYCEPEIQAQLKQRNNNRKYLLLDFCREIKHQFSSCSDAAGVIPISGQPYLLTSSRFYQMIEPYIEDTLTVCEDLVKSNGLDDRDISGVLMVGGSCRIPYIAETIENRLQTRALLIDEPELAVCQGAAIYGYSKTQPIVFPYQPPQKRFNFAKKITLTTLGYTGVGKTCYLIALYSYFTQGFEENYTLSAENLDRHNEFCDVWQQLVQPENNRWPRATVASSIYNLSFNQNNEQLFNFEYLDYRGGALRDKSSESDVKLLIDRAKESDCLFLFISGEYLTEEIVNSSEQVNNNVKAKVARYLQTRRINKLIELVGNEIGATPSKPFPIAIIITKYDLCEVRAKDNKTRREVIFRDVQELLYPLFTENSSWLTAIIPVTMGRKIADGALINPLGVHLPVIFAVYTQLRSLAIELKSEITQINNQLNSLSTLSRLFNKDEIDNEIKRIIKLQGHLDYILSYMQPLNKVIGGITIYNGKHEVSFGL